MQISIDELLSAAGDKLRNDFDYIKNSNPHYAERGAEAENILIQFLNSQLPKRYAASSGIVIDNENRLSKQIDVIVYDAINSPIYRKDERVMILPSDNVAIAIEVKSNLSKRELKDAAEKISSVKQLKRTPLTNVDQMVTFSDMVITTTMGVVFAYSSETSLEALASNLVEINKDVDINLWADLVVVLDKGTVSYIIKKPMGSEIGHVSFITTEKMWASPYYVSLVISELPNLVINEFYTYVLSHLTFFRKRTALGLKVATGHKPRPLRIIHNYQFNSNGEISTADENHVSESFIFESKFYIYKQPGDEYHGNIAYKKWKDGGVVFYSGRIKPDVIFSSYYRACRAGTDKFFPSGAQANDWCSIVLPLSQKQFEQVSLNALTKTLEKRGFYVSSELNIPGIPQE